MVGKLNRTLRGWANYFQVGTDQRRIPGARQLHRTAVAPVAAQQAQGQATQGRDLSTLAPLRALRARATDRTWARRGRGRRREVLSESRMREICMSGSMSGMWKRSDGEVTRAPPDERGGNRQTETYRHRATSRLYREGEDTVRFAASSAGQDVATPLPILGRERLSSKHASQLAGASLPCTSTANPAAGLAYSTSRTTCCRSRSRRSTTLRSIAAPSMAEMPVAVYCAK